MSQDNLIKLECTVCGRINYYSHRSKQSKAENKDRLQFNKYCKWDKKRTLHKETK